MRGGKNYPRPTSNTAFTLVEMLVVIAVIALLLGLLFPALAGIRADSKSTACLNNLRQIHLGIETYRQNVKGLMPLCAPLPAPTPNGPIGGLPEAIKHNLPRQSDLWLCPADNTQDSQDLMTSYFYLPGAWMVFEPPNLNMSAYENAQAIARLITTRWETGFLSPLPIMSDADEYHVHGDREPYNVLFIDGHVRPAKPTDSDLGDDISLPPDDGGSP